MPTWTNDPTVAVPILVPGLVTYSAGSRRPGPTARFIVTQSAVATNVVTLTGAIVEGNIPVVGDLIYVYATGNNAGALNTTTGIAISAATINAATGIGTISYPKTTGNLVATADVGYALIQPGETAESLVASRAYGSVAIQKLVPELGANRSFTVNVQFPVLDGGAVLKWVLQAALNNVDAEFANIIGDTAAAGTYSDSGTAALGSTPSSVTTQFYPGAWRFLRFKDDGSTGLSTTTVIAKVMC